MKKNILIGLISMAGLLTAGCGHNAVVYGDAVGFECGIIPDQYKLAISFRYGKTFTAVVKEKTKISLTTDGSGNGKSGNENAADTSVKTTLNMETGDQVTGYTVKLEEAKNHIK